MKITIKKLILFFLVCLVLVDYLVEADFIFSWRGSEETVTNSFRQKVVFDELIAAVNDFDFRHKALLRMKALDSEVCELDIFECDKDLVTSIHIVGLNGTINFSKLPNNVKNIQISDSVLSHTLTISSLPQALEILIFRNVSFSGSSAKILSSPQSLHTFSCIRCGLKDFSLSSADTLWEIDLSKNMLTTFSAEQLPPALQTLRVSGCPLQLAIDSVFELIPATTHTLDLSYSDLFISLEELEHVPLNLRELEIRGSTIGVDIASLLDVLKTTNIVSLSIADCDLIGKIQDFFIPKLTSLDASENNIVGVNWEAIPPQMKSLRLAKNTLSGPITLSVLPRGLTDLDVSHNAFSGTFDTNELPEGLEYLDISNNKFNGKIDLTKLPNSILFAYIQNNRFQGSLNLVDLPVGLRKILVYGNNWDVAFPKP